MNHIENTAEAATLVPNDLADYIEAIALDDSGAIYVVGKTASEHFPLVNPFQSTYGGGESDGFIAVFAPDGQSLQYSTYIGGSDFDIIKDIALTDTGRIVITGATDSADFPLANPYQPSFYGADGFVMVFEPDFLGLVYSTYVGGNDWDYPNDLAVDSTGTVHITGYTYSNDFPLVNPIQLYQGQEDVFVAGFAPDGQSLTYSTYIGGAENEQAYEIVLDGNGRKYLTGFTESPDFPIANAYQPTHQGYWDGFVVVLSANGQSLETSTFLGGSFSDRGNSIQLDSTNRIYVGGETESSNFPVVNPYQASKHGGWDGFLTIFNPDGQSLSYSTFLGGDAFDTLFSIFFNDDGRIYVTGDSFSTDFPLTNPLQANKNGPVDAFVTSFQEDGQALFYSTYLGGDESDVGYSIALDNNGLAYIAGTTWSDNFPTLNPYQGNITGYVDGFVTILNADGQALQYSTYLGSSYPSPTDVTLTALTSTTDSTSRLPSWLWLALGIILFFLASLLLGEIAGLLKKWSTKTK